MGGHLADGEALAAEFVHLLPGFVAEAGAGSFQVGGFGIVANKFEP